MNSVKAKGIIVALLHLAIVGGIGGKLLADRTTRPRVWARTAPVDPNLPIRGRYVRLRVEAAYPESPTAKDAIDYHRVVLTEENGQLIARSAVGSDGLLARTANRDGQRVAVIDQALAYFIPEHVPDPSFRAAGEELWVEVTLPRQGAPRPIRLGVRKDGQLTPLDID